MSYTVTVTCETYGRHEIGPFETAAECRDAYVQLRDETSEGASTFGQGRIVKDGAPVLFISYNGRVWNKPVSDWKDGDEEVEVESYDARTGGLRR